MLYISCKCFNWIDVLVEQSIYCIANKFKIFHKYDKSIGSKIQKFLKGNE